MGSGCLPHVLGGVCGNATHLPHVFVWYATLSATLLPESVIFSPSSLFPLPSSVRGYTYIYYIITLDLETLTTLI